MRSNFFLHFHGLTGGKCAALTNCLIVLYLDGLVDPVLVYDPAQTHPSMHRAKHPAAPYSMHFHLAGVILTLPISTAGFRTITLYRQPDTVDIRVIDLVLSRSKRQLIIKWH